MCGNGKVAGTSSGTFLHHLYITDSLEQKAKSGREVTEETKEDSPVIGATDHEYTSVRPVVGGRERRG